MSRNKLETYAPQARRDFIEAVAVRAANCEVRALSKWRSDYPTFLCEFEKNDCPC